VAAVHDGYVLHKSVARAPLGGALLARCMLHSVESKGVTVAPPYSFRRKERAPGQFEVGHRPAGVVSSRHAASAAVASSPGTCTVTLLVRMGASPKQQPDGPTTGVENGYLPEAPRACSL